MKILILTLSTLAMAGTAPALAAGGPLGPAPGSPAQTGRGPTGMAVGSFNGDSSLDVAVVNSSDATVSILLGNGKGGFRAAGTPVATGADPEGVAVGDFNRDGHQDLAITDNHDSDVAILLGNGTGGFTVTAKLSTVIPDDFTYGDPKAVLVGDLDSDGIQDLAVTTVGPGGRGEVETFHGAGNGSFSAAQLVTPKNAGIGSGSDAKLADLNGDGHLDIVLIDGYASDHRVDTLLGDGAGNFVQGPSALAGGGANALAVGDFNGDARQDVVTADHDAGTVSVFLGDGHGNLGTGVPTAAGATPSAVAVGDFNGDGRQDLAVANVDASTVTVLLGNGQGGFAVAQSVPVGSSPFSLVVGRFDADTIDDVATDAFNGTALDVLTSLASRTVTLRRHGRGATGRLTSRSPACVARQTVTLRRGSRSAGHTRTNATGRFAFRRKLRAGRYTAVVKAGKGCLAAGSKRVTLG